MKAAQAILLVTAFYAALCGLGVLLGLFAAAHLT